VRPAAEREVGAGPLRSAVDEAGRAVIYDGAGELVDPLPDGAAQPAAAGVAARETAGSR